MKGLTYTSEHLTWMAENYTLSQGDFHARFQERFRVVANVEGLARKRRSLGLKTGRKGVFVKRGCEGRVGTGTAHIGVPVGTEAVQRGVWCRKISDRLGGYKNWKQIHKIRWMELHGHIPKGMFLRSNGDALNTDPSNWTLVFASMLPDLNGWYGRPSYSRSPDELKPTIMGLAELKHALRQARREPLSQ